MGSIFEDVTKWNQQWNENASKYREGDQYIFTDEMPQLVVYLDTFEIDQVEVTNVRYRACVWTGACKPPYPKYYDDRANIEHPVVLISQEQARAYCQWVGKRLPSEAEWEKAARGTDGRLYPWGDDWDANRVNMKGQALQVGSFPAGASPYGVLDMIGSVSEWVEGTYGPYPGGYVFEKSDPQVKSSGSPVYRGGVNRQGNSIFIAELEMRTTTRERFSASDSQDIGFRCASGPQPRDLVSAIVRSAAPTPVATRTSVDLADMVFVPAGEFIMGTDQPFGIPC